MRRGQFARTIEWVQQGMALFPETYDQPAASSPSRSDDAVRLERWYRERDPADREALVERYLPLARQLALRYNGRGEREDLFQVASVGLLKAIDRFDPGRGRAFTALAVPTILGELKRYFRDHGWMVRVPRDIQELALRVDRLAADLTAELGREPSVEEIAARCGTTAEHVLEAMATATAHHAVSLDGLQSADEATDATVPAEPDHGYDRVDDAEEVERLLSVLPPRERRVLRLRFQQDLKQREIAELVGISQMQVSRLIARSLATLQEAAERG